MRVTWVWLVLDVPQEAPERPVEFWTRVARATLGPWGDAEAMLLPAHGDPWLRLRRSGGGSGLRLELETDLAPGDVREDLRSAGAMVLDQRTGGTGAAELVCRSPGGYELVVRSVSGGPVRTQVRHAQESLVDQVCLDIPPDRYAAEVEFWSALTGWAVQDVDSPEFQRLSWPRELPVRFLLQRLDEESGPVRAHPDLACADCRSEVDRHVAWGATELGPGDGWVVMEDPGGRRYCCTARDPFSGVHAR